MNKLFKRLAAAGVLVFVLSAGTSPRAQAVPPIDRKITYILPQWGAFLGATDLEVQQQVQQLRSRIGEGQRVRVGFTTYISVSMSPVDPADTGAVRDALAGTFANVDYAIARGRANGIPVCLSFLTAIRSSVDSLQASAQAEDRRNFQWHSDQSLASGWTTLSRYARKQELIQEAFIRELGRGLAARMALYPETLVAATGDGEIELSYDRSVQFGGAASAQATLIADYSPFAIAEFRDWLRGAGLYAAGQPFAGEAYRNSARYAPDASWSTLNADFGTDYTGWALRFGDWSLSDSIANDPRAIPVATYSQPGWSLAELPGGFDAPRVHQRGNAWSDLWDEFRQTMVWRHNLEFARWITTSADPGSGATVPSDRWFTDQIPADYLFGFTPQNPDLRLDTSASPHWTADVTPYGSLGITSFNQNFGGYMYKTLAGVAPRIAQRKVRWGIFEWNPSLPVNPDMTVYRDEMALVEQYRPSVLAPFYWQSADFPIENTGFETALREFVIRRNNVPLTLSRSSLYTQTLIDGSARTPPQVIRVSGEPGETPAWEASSSAPFIDIVKSADGRSFTVELKPSAYAAGVQSAAVVVSPAPGIGYVSTTLTVNVTATARGTTSPAIGSFDTPADLQVATGELGITGWAVDDVGVKSIDIYRSPLAGEPTQPNGLIYLGTANQVEGARPDVQGGYTTIPLSDKAGWGYMLLTNFMPNGGNGVFTIHALVTDVDGHTVSLGQRRIDCRNQSATVPFGTIDTPLQGQTVSGLIVNFGWVLTPNPNCIPIDGSTIDVFIDNVVVGHPVYNNPRSDIATLFPGLCNSGGAVGYYMLDTTTLTNGVHTIAWVARDSAGGATGMGSRYFTVANP